MESNTTQVEVVNRRMKMIESHFVSNKDVSPTLTHLFPLNCSIGINSIGQRYDSRMIFARQGSISQARFMRQVSIKKNVGRCNSFQRPASSCSPAIEDSSFNVSRTPTPTPLFSRQVQAKLDLPKFVEHQPVKQKWKPSMDEAPLFARQNKGLDEQNQIFSDENIEHAIESNGIALSPRMDIVESGRNYTMILELPGVSTNDIRVEINNQNLIVMGKHSNRWWRVGNATQDSTPKYHKREILQGPYKVVWPLPSDVKKDDVSAEFVDGLLQITLPKL